MKDLKITRTISTGVMFFVPDDDSQYGAIEEKIIEEFAKQPFGNVVAFNFSDDEFLQYWLSADVADEDMFHTACEWVVGKMDDLGALLDYVS